MNHVGEVANVSLNQALDTLSRIELKLVYFVLDTVIVIEKTCQAKLKQGWDRRE